MIYKKTKLFRTKLRFINNNLSFVFKYKRKIFNTRGYSVHSPYVYYFIHRVIKNNKPYYFFDSIWHEINHYIIDNGKHETITKRTSFELIFRIIDSLSLHRVCIITDNVKNNLLYRYIKNIDCNVCLYTSDNIDKNVCDNDIIVLETLKSNSLDSILNSDSDKKNIVVVITEKSCVKDKIKEILRMSFLRTLSIIELNNMDIWLVGYDVSSRRTKLYYK